MSWGDCHSPVAQQATTGTSPGSALCRYHLLFRLHPAHLMWCLTAVQWRTTCLPHAQSLFLWGLSTLAFHPVDEGGLHSMAHKVYMNYSQAKWALPFLTQCNCEHTHTTHAHTHIQMHTNTAHTHRHMRACLQISLTAVHPTHTRQL